MGPAGQLVFEMSFGTQAEVRSVQFFSLWSLALLSLTLTPSRLLSAFQQHCLDASLRSAYFLSRGASFVGINPRGWGRSTSFPKADEKKKKTDVTVSGDVQFAIEWVMQHQFATQFQANGYADAVIAGYSLGGYSATRAAVELAVAGTPPGALLLINSIASSYLAAKDDFAGPIAKLGEKALGSKFDMLTALRAFCQLRRPDGGEMRLIAISGNDRLDHLSLTKTDIPTVGAACSVHSGETDPQFGHFALAKMFSHGQNGPNDA